MGGLDVDGLVGMRKWDLKQRRDMSCFLQAHSTTMYVLSKFEFRIARASEVFNQLISFIDNLGLSCKFYSKKNVHLLQLSLTTLLLI